MLWFKNAIVYQLNKDTLLDEAKIEQAVTAHPFVACGNTDSTKSGWVSPYGQSDERTTINIDGQILLRLKKETKMLPNSVVKDALNEKIAKHEAALNRKLKKTEKIALKDEVFIDLLPRAFSKYQFYWLWIDTINKQLIIDAGSFKQAEEMLAILRKEIGSLAIMPFSSKTPIEQIMTKWVRDDLHYDPILLSDEIELQDPVEQSCTVKCKNQEITSNEVFVHIDAGKQVSKLKLNDERGLSFMLNKDCTFKRIKFDAVILDKNEDFTAEEYDRKLEADFILMTKALADTLQTLFIVINKII